MLASATRITGIFLFPALLIEYMSQNEYRIKGIKLNFLYLFLILIGLIAYIVINYITFGDPFAFLDAQREYWNKTLSPPSKGLMGAWNYIRWNPTWIQINDRLGGALICYIWTVMYDLGWTAGRIFFSVPIGIFF